MVRSAQVAPSRWLPMPKLRLPGASCGKTALSKCRACHKRAQKPRFCARKARKRGFQRAKAHKNRNFVLEIPENGGSRPKKRTKMPILCSKSPKTRVPKAKKAQKCRFCARNARKWGFRRAKTHKNADFVLGKKGNGIGKTGKWHRETCRVGQLSFDFRPSGN